MPLNLTNYSQYLPLTLNTHLSPSPFVTLHSLFITHFQPSSLHHSPLTLITHCPHHHSLFIPHHSKLSFIIRHPLLNTHSQYSLLIIPHHSISTFIPHRSLLIFHCSPLHLSPFTLTAQPYHSHLITHPHHFSLFTSTIHCSSLNLHYSPLTPRHLPSTPYHSPSPLNLIIHSHHSHITLHHPPLFTPKPHV